MIAIGKYLIPLYFILCTAKCESLQNNATPVVLWHGMGDSCCFSFSLGGIKKLIEATVPNVYVYSVRIGNNEIEDVQHSYFGSINGQIEAVCDQLSKDQRLKDGYNAIGFSQGAQFLRAVIQRCPTPPILNYISLGGQHQGVFGLPICGMLSRSVCDHMIRIIKYGAYLKFVQENFIQATYWHDPYQEADYKQKSTFIAEINNEYHINKTYKDNLQKVNTMVLVKFDNDTMVRPPESEWFGFYEPGQGKKIQTFEETDVYRKDQLGLKRLHQSGKIHFLSLPGNHLQFNESWFIESIINTYLT